MSSYKFEDIAFNITQKRKPTTDDMQTYIGLEHLDRGSLSVSRWGSNVPIKGDKLIMQAGDVLFGKRNAYLRRAAIAPHDGLFSAHGMVLKPNKKVILKALFPFFVCSDYFIDAAIRISVGSLSPTINWSALKELEFNLPDMKKQEKLAELLWAANDTKEAYKKLFSLTDALLKSQFIEMFGDPVVNPKGWTINKLSNLTTKIGSGATPKGGQENYKSEGISLIRSLNVYNGSFKYEDLAFIDDTQAKQLSNVIVEKKDVLINITGASVARSCIVPDDVLPARVNQHVSILRCNCNEISYMFLNQLLTSLSYQRLLLGIGESGGATRQAITKQQLEYLEIILPPIELQNQFADFVIQINKSKFELYQTISSLENTIKSLMQRYLI